MRIKIYLRIAIVFAVMCIGSLPVLAQKVVTINANAGNEAELPADTAVRIGKLANGFTYFIRHNANPKNRVIFYLANKVGSVLENDNQQGLAHFMEHMNFNGTTHFPKNQLSDYLQKAGVRFGADVNAYTGFDETVFQLPIASDRQGLLDTGLLIMHDWAQGALLEASEIDKERGVVLEEKRLRKGAQQRLQQQYMPVLFNHSRYGQRLPIGMDSVISYFKPETINEFYHDWYRPDLQALIVVGDIDVNQMEEWIKERFSDLKNPVNEKPRTKYSIALTGANQFIAVTDREQTNTNVQVLIKREGKPIKTGQDYKEHIIENLFNIMLSGRYGELSEQKDHPFIAGGAGIGPFIGGLRTFSVRVVAKPGELESGFKAIWQETERLKRFGFTATELDRAKKQFLKNRETAAKQISTATSQPYVNEYLDHFLTGNAIPGTAKEYEISKEAMAGITLADVNGLINHYQTDTNRDIIVIAPEEDKANLPGDATLTAWIKQVQEEKMEPYKDGFMAQPLLNKPPVSGKIEKQIELKEIHAKKYILSNGVSVILKPEKFVANDILVKGFASGGLSLYPDKDYESGRYAAYLVTTAGLGNFNFSELKKYLSGTTAFIAMGITDYGEDIQAAASPDDMETLLQMIYLYFTQPKKDSVAYHNLIVQEKASLAKRQNNPSSIFEDTVEAVMGNYSTRRTGSSLEKVEQIDLNRSYEIYKECFSDASGFTFTFVGDFDSQKLDPLIEKYLASLPSTYQKKQPKDLHLHPAPGKITKVVYKGMEDKATVRLTFTGNYEFNAVNNMNMDALAEILQIRLIERLREEESGVYSPSVVVSHTKIPGERFGLGIYFGCAPKNVDKLIASALDEVNKLKSEGPSAVNLEKFKAESRSIHETKLRKIDFWSDYIKKQLLNGNGLNEVNTYDSILNQVTPESLKSTAQKYLGGDNFIKLVLMPEKTGK
jgi:zinc protease